MADNDGGEFEGVLESAARLQRLVPDAVLVGGSAAAVHAGHRMSTDHDHVLTDLNRRFDAVLDAVENDDGWATNRVTPGKIILGNLDGIETGIRQLIRRRPLETERVTLRSGAELTVPTIDEALRVKAFLSLRRNTVRDYLDCAALADHIGIDRAAQVLSAIDDYYADQIGEGDGIATQVARQFSDPKPKDSRVIGELDRYKELEQRWTKWPEVTAVLGEVAAAMVDLEGER
ncbi:MAG: hypothetical protein J2P18_20415 [Nocardia sp.]|nr:hypothetical protein [Nocardia sp.]